MYILELLVAFLLPVYGVFFHPGTALVGFLMWGAFGRGIFVSYFERRYDFLPKDPLLRGAAWAIFVCSGIIGIMSIPLHYTMSEKFKYAGHWSDDHSDDE